MSASGAGFYVDPALLMEGERISREFFLMAGIVFVILLIIGVFGAFQAWNQRTLHLWQVFLLIGIFGLIAVLCQSPGFTIFMFALAVLAIITALVVFFGLASINSFGGVKVVPVSPLAS